MSDAKGPKKPAKESIPIHIPMNFNEALKALLQTKPPPKSDQAAKRPRRKKDQPVDKPESE